MTEPRISVVIPVWNGEHCISKLLEQIGAQTLPRDRFDVIVVDNGSTDATVEIVRRYAFARLLFELRPGSYSARNAGLAAVETQFVAFTDADCVPEPDWLENGLTALLRHPEAAVVAGEVRMFSDDGGGNRACEAYERLFFLNQARNAMRGACVTANWFSRTDVLREHGGFDASLRSGGDFDLAFRITKSGRIPVHAPDAVVHHPVRGRLGEVVAKSRRTFGGSWKKYGLSKPPLTFAWGIVRQHYGTANYVLGLDRMDRLLRLRVAALVALLACVNLVEFARLSLGGEPRRS